MKQTDKTGSISRRKFLDYTAVSAAAFAVVPRHVLGGEKYVAPSDRLNLAVIGTGGQGIQNIKNLLLHQDIQVIAICDVNEYSDYNRFYYKGTAGRLPALKVLQEHAHCLDSKNSHKCTDYVDFREMLDKEKTIDAVLIATPDHNHAIAALAAIEAGKHVYCEKPLAHSIYETRKITEAAREAGVATQMGNHGHSSEDIRLMVEWIRDGAVGEIREVHAWTQYEGCERAGSGCVYPSGILQRLVSLI